MTIMTVLSFTHTINVGIDEFSGFKIKSIGCSCTSMVIACDDGKLIAWGSAPTYGELVSEQIDFISRSIQLKHIRFWVNFILHIYRASVMIQSPVQSHHLWNTWTVWMCHKSLWAANIRYYLSTSTIASAIKNTIHSRNSYQPTQNRPNNCFVCYDLLHPISKSIISFYVSSSLELS